MFDRQDEIGKVFRSYAANAARLAVFAPLLSFGWSKYPDPIRRAVVKVRRRWVWLLKKLEEGLWRNTAKGDLYLRNCSPFGIQHTNRPVTQCCGVRICPWCYGRLMIRQVRRVQYALWHSIPEEAQPHVHSQYILVGFRTWHNFHPPKFHGALPSDIRDTLRKKLVKAVRNERYREAKMVGAVGAVISHGTYYKLNDTGVTLLRFGVLAVPIENKEKIKKLLRGTNYLDRVIRQTTYQTLEGDKMTQHNLVRLFARFYRFPATYFSAPAKETIDMLEALKGVKFFTTQGIFSVKLPKKKKSREPKKRYLETVPGTAPCQKKS